jgi:hypothetical protein
VVREAFEDSFTAIQTPRGPGIGRYEIAHPHDLGGLGILECEGFEGIVDGEPFLGRHGHGDAGLVKFLAGQITTVFEALFASGDVDENLLHRVARRLEEVAAIDW